MPTPQDLLQKSNYGRLQVSEVQPFGLVCVAAAKMAAATQTKVYLMRVQTAIIVGFNRLQLKALGIYSLAGWEQMQHSQPALSLTALK